MEARRSDVLEAPSPLKLKLLECARTRFQNSELSAVEKEKLNKVYDSFDVSTCSGCHNTPTSKGGVAFFTLGTPGQSKSKAKHEFLKGIAYRHVMTRYLAEQCLDGEEKKKANRFFSKIRTKVPNGLEYFSHGSEAEMHELARSFLSGGFEVPTGPGELQHDALFEWFDKASAKMPLSLHIDALVDILR